MAQSKKSESRKAGELPDLKEDVMFEFMKELFAFGYTAADRMEERAAEFAKMRRERMEEFRTSRQEAADKIKGGLDERTGEFAARLKKEVQSVMRESGVATQAEVQDLKGMIADLAAKVDKLGGAEPKKAK